MELVFFSANQAHLVINEATLVAKAIFSKRNFIIISAPSIYLIYRIFGIRDIVTLRTM